MKGGGGSNWPSQEKLPSKSPVLLGLKIASFSTNEKLNFDLQVQFSMIATTLGWILYLKIALMIGSLICRDVKSS